MAADKVKKKNIVNKNISESSDLFLFNQQNRANETKE